MSNHFQVAIDGPVGSGKSTIAQLVAKRLGFVYVYTGAMYRAAALLAKRAGISWTDDVGVARIVNDAHFTMRNTTGKEKDGRMVTILVDGQDVSSEVMEEEYGQGASQVGIYRNVRSVLVSKQQEIARSNDVVMEGRDTTFRVLPDAQLKIFLTADEEERARRRYKQLIDKGENISYGDVLAELRKRDERDSERSVDPLQVVSDAWVLDTTDLTVNQVARRIVERVQMLQESGGEG